jgi:hypothetical protein
MVHRVQFLRQEPTKNKEQLSGVDGKSKAWVGIPFIGGLIDYWNPFENQTGTSMTTHSS